MIRENPRIVFRALQEDAELLAEVRRLVLTDEVLAMPGQLADVIERQDRAEGQLAEVIRVQNALLETQNRILSDQDDMLETQGRLLEGQDEMRGDIRALHGMYRRQHDDQSRFRGGYADRGARKNSPDIVGLFARHLGISPRQLNISELSEAERKDMIGQNLEALRELDTSDTAWLTFPRGDVIARITDWDENGADAFYIAIEASYTGSRRDAQRAVDHAKILRRATGQDAYPVVAAVRMAPSAESMVSDDVAQFVETGNEDFAFWYQLGEEGMEPPDVC